MASASNARRGKGRKKVEMKRMEDKASLGVTFSKRRQGLFKKASELCTLTGAKIGIIVYSPSKRSFSFGHPSIHDITQKVFPTYQNYGHLDVSNVLIESYQNATITEYNKWLTMLDEQLKVEQTKYPALVEKEKVERARIGWERPIEELSVTQLEERKMVLLGLKEKIGAMHHRGANLVRACPAPQTGNLSLIPSSFQGCGFEGSNPIPMMMANIAHNPSSVSGPNYGCFNYGQGAYTSPINTQTSNIYGNPLIFQGHGFEGSNPIPMVMTNTQLNPPCIMGPDYGCFSSEQGMTTSAINTQMSYLSRNPLNLQGYGFLGSYPTPVVMKANIPLSHSSVPVPYCEVSNSGQVTDASTINP